MARGRSWITWSRTVAGACSSERTPPASPTRRRSRLGNVQYAAMGRSNKYVAYLLGLTSSTVSEHLASAQRKLGFRTRADFVRALAPMVQDGASKEPKAEGLGGHDRE